MVRARVKFRLHRTAIVLICLALLVVLMQGASYFSLSHQMARSEQVEDLSRTLSRQVAYSLSPLMGSVDDNGQRLRPSSNNSPIIAVFWMLAYISRTVRWWRMWVNRYSCETGWR